MEEFAGETGWMHSNRGPKMLIFKLKKCATGRLQRVAVFECLILFFSHQGGLCRCFIPVAAEMKHPVGHHPVEFLLEAHLVGLCIVADSFDADENIPFHLWRFRIGECDDIGKGVVLEVLDVQLEQVVVSAENEIQAMQPAVFAPYQPFQPGSGETFIFQLEVDVFGIEKDSRLRLRREGRLVVHVKGGVGKVSSDFENHLNGAAVVEKADVVGQLAHEENTSAAAFTEVFWRRGIREIIVVKSGALICHAQCDAVAILAGLDFHGFALLPAISVHNGIGDSLREADENTALFIGAEVVAHYQAINKWFNLGNISRIRCKFKHDFYSLKTGRFP